MAALFGIKMPDRRALVYLAGAAVCLWCSSPQWVVPAAAWIGPLFTLRFMRRYRPVRGAVIVWMVSSAVGIFANKGFVPLPLAGHLIFTPAASLVAVLPYLADRILAPRIKGFRSTLVLPLAYTTLDYAQSFFLNGTILSPAYTQAGNLPLIQIASVTGVWGITFLLYWFAPVVSWLWDRAGVAGLRGRSMAGAYAYAIIMASVLCFGTVRLLLPRPTQTTVRAAGISVDNLAAARAAYGVLYSKPLALPAEIAPGDPALTQAYLALDAFFQHPDEPKYTPVHRTLDRLYDELFALSEREAGAGAKIIAWSEANAWVLKPDEAALIERGRRFARGKQVYLYMTLATFTPGAAPFTGERATMENKIVAIGPDGNVLSTYLKTKLPVGERSVRGDGRIPVQQTPYGALAAAICYDLDTPEFVRQVGQAEAGLMLVPSGDWKAATPWHPQLAKLRAIENGFALLRPVSNGLFLAADQYGRTLGTLDYFSTPVRAMAVTVPVEHVATVYTRIGDSFAWTCAAGFIGLLAGCAVARLRLRLPGRRLQPVT
ncbi:MAG TPA: nitrilase-related carbon-nitrogen hydrolase [Herpetosiphonaceae bacterium]|nr:nitrilase-related carbon-nitrogen hydrolase [Herpetosiphonaceae bacterium]